MSHRTLLPHPLVPLMLCVCLGTASATPSAQLPENYISPRTSSVLNIPPPLPPTEQCPLSTFDVEILAQRGLTTTSSSDNPVGGFYVAADYTPACLESRLLAAAERCKTWSHANPDSPYSPVQAPYYFDDCLQYDLIGSGHFGAYTGYQRPANSWQANDWTCGIEQQDEPTLGMTICWAGQVMLDNQCNSVLGQDWTAGCDAGTFQYSISPISLIWEGDDLDEEVVFTQFPLDPQRTGTWNVWRASQRAPLLVFDPEHKGRIVSAFQLFGNWTFGGQQLAAMFDPAKSATGFLAGAAWENGYEPLGTLDRNNDRRLDGAELESLGLWFDENRDGVSQTGEVKQLGEVGVVSLYYTPDRKEGNHVYASVGYERVVAGKRVVGSSVDWFAEGGASQAELIAKHLIHDDTCETRFLRAAPAPHVHKPSLESTAKFALGSDLDGLWRWRQETGTQANGASLGGFLSFKDGGSIDRVFSGHSMIETKLTSKKGNVHSSMKQFPIKGTKGRPSADGLPIDFTVETKEGAKVKSAALLLPDGLTLKGTSVASVRIAGKARTIKYSWVARRIAY